ncbi:MAG: hypothetical protein KME17_22285 [Cyanosarcina radialis HA8281-LM2]|jgi:hypothetical protein|nr:hypothetical protein [Cyanosarcina radialis HA8281-LM2]
MQQISKLTAQQETLLLEYKKKWQLAALSTQALDKQKATQIIEAIHKKLSQDVDFDIYFFDSPVAIADLSFIHSLYPTENWCNPKKLNNLIRRIKKQFLKKYIGQYFFQQIVMPLVEIIGKQVDMKLWHYLEKELHFWSPFSGLIDVNLKDKEKLSVIWKSAKPNQQIELEQLWRFLARGLVTADSKCSVCCLLDYCISVLHCTPEEHLWQLLKTFVADCGWTFFFQDFCLVCDRPCTIILDEEYKPHSENEAAIEFSDGFKIFAEHGNSIPFPQKADVES